MRLLIAEKRKENEKVKESEKDPDPLTTFELGPIRDLWARFIVIVAYKCRTSDAKLQSLLKLHVIPAAAQSWFLVRDIYILAACAVHCGLVNCMHGLIICISVCVYRCRWHPLQPKKSATRAWKTSVTARKKTLICGCILRLLLLLPSSATRTPPKNCMSFYCF